MQNEISVVSEQPSEVTGLMGFPGSIFRRAPKEAAQTEGRESAQLTRQSLEQVDELTSQLQDLKAEVECLRAERDRLSEIQGHVLELLGTQRPDRLVHDLRNVLNERALFRALAETVM